jgi:hypothetical protein
MTPRKIEYIVIEELPKRHYLSDMILSSDFFADFFKAFIASSPSGVGNNTLIATREPFSWEISINIGLDQGLGFLVLYL